MNSRNGFALRARTAGLAALLGAVITVVGGCAAGPQGVSVTRVDTHEYPPSMLVEVLRHAPAQPYKVLARFDASAPAGTPIAQLLAQLQERAAAMGANAIIVQDLSTTEAASVQFNPSGGQFQQQPTQIVPRLHADAIRFVR